MPEVPWREITLIGGVIAVLIIVYYFFLAPVPPGAPGWSFEGWYQNDIRVDTALVDQPVTLKLKLTGAAPMSAGTLRVEIKKDVRLWWDVVAHTETVPIALGPGAVQIVEVTFTPDEGTDGVAEYFFKLYWNEKVVWDPQARGARYGLKVTEAAPLTFHEVEFEGYG